MGKRSSAEEMWLIVGEHAREMESDDLSRPVVDLEPLEPPSGGCPFASDASISGGPRYFRFRPPKLPPPDTHCPYDSQHLQLWLQCQTRSVGTFDWQSDTLMKNIPPTLNTSTTATKTRPMGPASPKR